MIDDRAHRLMPQVRTGGELTDLQRIAIGGRVSRLWIEGPAGCIGGGYPECNALMPLWHYAAESKVPAAKAIPVTVHSEGSRVVATLTEHAAG